MSVPHLIWISIHRRGKHLTIELKWTGNSQLSSEVDCQKYKIDMNHECNWQFVQLDWISVLTCWLSVLTLFCESTLRKHPEPERVMCPWPLHCHSSEHLLMVAAALHWALWSLGWKIISNGHIRIILMTNFKLVENWKLSPNIAMIIVDFLFYERTSFDFDKCRVKEPTASWLHCNESCHYCHASLA